MKIFKSKYALAALVAGSMLTSCDLDEKFYSSVTPDTFITNKESTYSILARPFTHWRYYYGYSRYYFQEYTTDEMCVPARGNDFYNGGEYIRLYEHTWTPDERYTEDTYNETVAGIARCLETREDLNSIDYPSIGVSNEIKADQLSQLDAMTAFFYMWGLDFYGGMPIYSSTNDDLRPRSTAKETFDLCEKLLTEAIPKIMPKQKLGAKEDGYISQAAAAGLLARLYLNAEAWVGEDRYADAAKICQDIIDGVYGPYKLDDTWYGPHGFNNDTSPEMIWTVPSDHNHGEYTWYYRYFYHQQSRIYFNVSFPAAPYNGHIIAPSHENASSPVYTQYKLGCTMAKFNDSDLRKKPYVYHGNGQYEGMFCMGDQKNPYTGQWVKGQKDMAGQNLSFVDYVNKDGKGSSMMNGAENSGYRLVKMPIPNDDDIDLLWNPDFPAMRLTEIYYMLAECKWRAGDGHGAAQLINTVRKRNFEGGIDPDPVPDNFDIYRLADEHLIEFLGEMHRRTDLIRWGLFTTEEWWCHKPTDPTKKKFPIPSKALSANLLLEQNPGYSR